jgi:Uma2 family endonuclease
MQEYAENGVRLGLLINPQDQQVEIYQVDGAVSVLANPASVDCSEVLPEFVLDLQRIL